MNRIGFNELHRPKTPTEKLEEIKARRDREHESIVAVGGDVWPEYSELTQEQLEWMRYYARKDREYLEGLRRERG